MTDERRMDLMAGAALGDLDADELAELQALGASEAEIAALERTVAAVAVASVKDRAMPDALRARIERATGLPPRIAVASMPASASTPASASMPASASAPAPASASAPASAPKPARRSASAIVGWLAAAALLVLALLGWLRPWVKTPTVERARAELIATAPDAKVIAWTPTADQAGAGASGDVVWSDAKQTGYMRFRGLAQNNPEVTQYQLWIFDPAQDQRYPVDGGVFDVAKGGEVIVPIHAKLHVESPTLFAVTVERSGGVVVSKRERIVVTATASR